MRGLFGLLPHHATPQIQQATQVEAAVWFSLNMRHGEQA
ncbi:hypothetical protein BS78_04G240400 [Paspalum vaginatum]|nr:hypothetical protein BS78_04G240400 [Paspalum vaginatum]